MNVRRFGGEVPSAHAEKGVGAIAELGQQVGPLVEAYTAALEARKLKDGIRIAMSISSLGETTCSRLATISLQLGVRHHR